jgi:hypothetical protein
MKGMRERISAACTLFSKTYGYDSPNFPHAWRNLMSTFARFLKERRLLQNCSSNTILWYEEAFKHLRIENPDSDDPEISSAGSVRED